MKITRHYNRWEPAFAWLPVEVIGEDWRSIIWLQRYWRCRRYRPVFGDWMDARLEMPRPEKAEA